MKPILFRALVLAALASPGAALAQHPLVLEKLRELDRNAPQPPIAILNEKVLGAAKAIAAREGTCSPGAVNLSEIKPITGARSIMQGVMTGQIRNGWTIEASLQGCPDAPIRRFMILQRADGEIVAAKVNDGRSHANPVIMSDTSASAAAMAWQKVRAQQPSCDGKDIEMGEARILSESPDLGPEIFGVRYVGSWTESWRFTVCGVAVDVPIEFRADGDGGAYTDVKHGEVTIAR